MSQRKFIEVVTWPWKILNVFKFWHMFHFPMQIEASAMVTANQFFSRLCAFNH